MHPLPKPNTEELDNFLPERNLLAEILRRAIIDLFLKGDYKRQASRWLNEESETEFSFNWICKELDLSPTYMREFIKYKINRKTRILIARNRVSSL